ncbi:phage tail length tape measure family protein [Agrobacterium sp.]|uniref:phage tail length tape measure family protein n=1 Tax=Agrobacterium sp. TaxID=361 RepID=UPI0025B8D293|nr:phage tail length tape measure family protein [Agrobacterium sp.]MCD4663127.1 phage tail length tape measure family protein [Agrobacterium sp.]
MTAPYRISIGVNIDPSGAKTGSTESVKAVSQIATAAERARPSLEKLVNSFAGLDRQGANSNGRAADIAAYGAALDKLQAKFDPLFAAQKRHQATIEGIAEAERVGAISASAAIDLRAKERIAIEGLVAANDRLAASRKRTAETMVARATVTPDRESDIAAYGAELDRLRARYNPLYATIVNYKAVQTDIREAHKLGAISTDEMTAALSRQRQATLAVIAAQKGRDTGAGFSSPANDRFRRQNLTYQVFDIGQTAAMGMNPAMIFAQQGPQILQLYAGQGGINTALKDFRTIAASAARVFTPLAVGMAGLAAAAVTGAVAYNGYLRSMKEVDTAASGLGRAVAGSRAEMEAAAQAGAAAAGISVSSARSMEAQFLRTGRIGSENFESLIAISKDFGATFGVTADEAGTMLAEMFADPAKAAETLYQKYGLINAATARHASNLAAQNRQSEAQAVLLKALPDQLASASEATTALGRAWAFVARNASNAFDNVGSFLDKRISGPTLEEQIAKAEEAQKRLTAFGGMFDIFNPGKAAAIADAARLPELQAEQRRRDAFLEEQKKQAEENARSRAAVPLYEASPANARALQEQKLRNDIAAMESARGIDSIDAGQNEAAIEAKKRALDALVNSQSRAIELDRLDIQIANERNPLLRAELEARRVRIQMAAQEKSSTEIEAAASLARNRVIEETIAGAKAQAADMRAEAETRARLNSLVASGAVTASDANRMLQEELTLRPLIAAAAAAEGTEKAQLERQIAALRDGYAALTQQEKLSSAQEYLRGNQEKLQQLRLQQALIGENALVQERANALLEVEQRIRRDGIDTNSSLATAMRDQADAMATLNRQIERQAEAWDTVKSAADSAIDEGIDKLLDGDFSGALESVADEVKGLFSELAIKNPIKNAFLGGDDPTMTDVGGLGGIVSRLFGGKGAADPKSLVSSVMGQSVGTMSVNAATVIINGSVAGGLSSLLGGAANDNSNVVQFPGSVASTGKAVDLASSLLGSTETGNRIDINSFLSKGGVDIDAAQTAWCAGFVNSALKQIGVDGSGSLTANSFLNWGTSVDPSKILRGDVLVQSRGLSANQAGGHVGFATGQSRMTNGQLQLEMLSGNYRNGVGAGWVNAADVQARRASEALNNLAGASGTATQGLGTLGAGFDQFGKNLSGLFPSAPSAAGGSGLSSLFGNFWGNLTNGAGTQWAGIASGAITGGLFSEGGYTGPGGVHEPRGVVHAGEVVWSQRDVARAGGPAVVDAMRLGKRGYASGGVVDVSPWWGGNATTGGSAAFVANSNVRNAPIINNYGSSEVQYEEQTDQHGNRQPVITIGRQMAAAIRQPGNPANRALQGEFGVKRQAVRRW